MTTTDLVTKRCSKCRQILLKHTAGAFVVGATVEVKCKCNHINYVEELEAGETSMDDTRGRSKAVDRDTH